MTRAPAHAASGALVLCALSIAAPARAAVTLSTEVSPRKVEAGDRFIVRLRATSDGNEPVTNPELKVPAGITGSGPNVSSQSQISIVNGQMTQSIGISATWILVAKAPGTYKLGPASVVTPDGRKSDRAVTVEVVPPGSLPPPPLAGQPLDPFGMLRGLGGPGFPGLSAFPELNDVPRMPSLQELPEEWRVERLLDPVAFLRARAVPRRVVVGEQVNLTAFAYGSRGDFGIGNASEPSRNDFLAFNLDDNDGRTEAQRFEEAGQTWLAAKIAEFALFPLKAGRLKAGEMSVGFTGPRYSKDPLGLERKSAAVEIEVVEPPLNGRPPGYKLGDVGHYNLNANVEPREVPAGGSISIVAKLEGTGNVPFSLLVPERDGVHFLEPQLIDQVAPKRGIVQGFRTFTYVVELSQPGQQELGEITLPYYDAKAKAYGVARAALGKVNVTGTAKPQAASGGVAGVTSSAAHLKGLVTPPAELGPGDGGGSYWPSRLTYWLLLLGLPLAAVLGFALSDLARLLAQRAREKRSSLGATLDEARRNLAEAVREGNAANCASAAERLLFVAIELGTGVKGRGVLKTQLATALAMTGVSIELAAHAADLLGRCDELRFAGEALDLAGFARDVTDTCQKLSQLKLQRPGAPS